MRTDVGAALVEQACLALATVRRRPLLFGIAGGVGVGKTTAAAELVAALRGDGVRAEQLSTDCFLHPNEVLVARGAIMEKGFPHTYDHDLASRTVAGLSHGQVEEVPVYSHATYDRLPGQRQRVGGTDVVVIEGIYTLQPAVADHLDVAVYLDAAEALLRSWFIDRFLALCRQAETDEASFYRLFVALDEAGRREQASGVWDTINGVNLREHILPTQARADLVMEKGEGHALLRVRRQGSGASSPT